MHLVFTTIDIGHWQVFFYTGLPPSKEECNISTHVCIWSVRLKHYYKTTRLTSAGKKTKAAGQTWTESSLTRGNSLFPVHQQLEQWLWYVLHKPTKKQVHTVTCNSVLTMSWFLVNFFNSEFTSYWTAKASNIIVLLVYFVSHVLNAMEVSTSTDVEFIILLSEI